MLNNNEHVFKFAPLSSRVVSPNGEVVYVNHEDESTTYTDPRLAFAVEEKEHANDYRQRFDASSTALGVSSSYDEKVHYFILYSPIKLTFYLI